MTRHPLPTTKLEQVTAYFQIMREVKTRFDTIDSVRQSGGPPGIVAEMCHLQIRHICDIVTIGAVILHGDYAPQIANDISPAKIFRALDKKYPAPFPQPATVTWVEKGPQKKEVTIVGNQVPDAATRDEFIKMWSQSGDFLHRLNISKFFRQDAVVHDSLAQIDANVKKLRALLNVHLYGMRKPATELFVTRLQDENGFLEAFFVEYKPDGKVEIRQFDATVGGARPV